jgi:hypothetical protein
MSLSQETSPPKLTHIWTCALLGLLLGSGCSSPSRLTDKEMTPYDDHTQYAIEEREDGFVITVGYSQYQFVRDGNSVAEACRSALKVIAHEIADKQNKKIEPLDEQRIRISIGRNGLTGRSSCYAQGVAKWRTEK